MHGSVCQAHCWSLHNLHQQAFQLVISLPFAETEPGGHKITGWRHGKMNQKPEFKTKLDPKGQVFCPMKWYLFNLTCAASSVSTEGLFKELRDSLSWTPIILDSHPMSSTCGWSTDPESVCDVRLGQLSSPPSKPGLLKDGKASFSIWAALNAPSLARWPPEARKDLEIFSDEHWGGDSHRDVIQAAHKETPRGSMEAHTHVFPC